jgi:hypothetical protein
MMPMDMRSLLTLLEAIKRICTYEKGELESCKKLEKSFNKGKNRKKHPGTYSTARVPKRVCFEKHCNLCDCCRFEKNGKEKSDFHAAKKGGRKGDPLNHNYAQLTKKIEKLEKALKKSGMKGRKHQYEDSDSDSK